MSIYRARLCKHV